MLATVADTLGTEPLEYKIGRMEVETFGQINLGDGQFLETERPLAPLAVEVGVQVRQTDMQVLAAAASWFAQGVFELPRAIIDGMDKVVVQEEGQRPEDRRLVYSAKTCLEIGERECADSRLEGAENEDAVGCRTNIARGKQGFVIRFFHVVIAILMRR